MENQGQPKKKKKEIINLLMFVCAQKSYTWFSGVNYKNYMFLL